MQKSGRARTRLIRLTAAAIAVVALSLAATAARADDRAAAGATTTDQSAPILSEAQLDQLVAPIALYPDQLLASVLVASTYPLEVIEADRFAQANKNLKADALANALAGKDWDENVKALVGASAVLAMMSEQLDWTQQLGDAVLSQQPDVMDAVQRLRTKAQANGQLKTTAQQTVNVVNTAAAPVVQIVPAQPETVYVPYYNPTVVYGPWPYPNYAPYYWPPPPGFVVGSALAAGIAFGAGVAWVSAVTGGFDWYRHDIDINRNVNVNVNRNVNVKTGTWQHDPQHRGGVRYSNADVEKKFSKANVGNSNQRIDFRGRSGNTVIKTGDVNIGKGAGANVNKQALGNNVKGGAKIDSAKVSGGAFNGIDAGGAKAKTYSDRGKESVKSFNAKSAPQAKKPAAAVRKPAAPHRSATPVRPKAGTLKVPKAGGDRGGLRRR